MPGFNIRNTQIGGYSGAVGQSQISQIKQNITSAQTRHTPLLDAAIRWLSNPSIGTFEQYKLIENSMMPGLGQLNQNDPFGNLTWSNELKSTKRRRKMGPMHTLERLASEEILGLPKFNPYQMMQPRNYFPQAAIPSHLLGRINIPASPYPRESWNILQGQRGQAQTAAATQGINVAGSPANVTETLRKSEKELQRIAKATEGTFAIERRLLLPAPSWLHGPLASAAGYGPTAQYQAQVEKLAGLAIPPVPAGARTIYSNQLSQAWRAVRQPITLPAMPPRGGGGGGIGGGGGGGGGFFGSPGWWHSFHHATGMFGFGGLTSAASAGGRLGALLGARFGVPEVGAALGAAGAAYGAYQLSKGDIAEFWLAKRKPWFDYQQNIYRYSGSVPGARPEDAADVQSELQRHQAELARFGIGLPTGARMLREFPVARSPFTAIYQNDVYGGLAMAPYLSGFSGLPLDTVRQYITRMASTFPQYQNPRTAALSLAPLMGVARESGMAWPNIFSTTENLTNMQAQATFGMYASPNQAFDVTTRFAQAGTTGGLTGLTAQMVQGQIYQGIAGMGGSAGTLTSAAFLLERMKKQGVRSVLGAEVYDQIKATQPNVLAGLESTLDTPAFAMPYLSAIAAANPQIWTKNAAELTAQTLPGASSGLQYTFMGGLAGISPVAAALNEGAQKGSGGITAVPPMFQTAIQAAANRYGVSPAALEAIFSKESNFNPMALNLNANGTRDYGMGQINDINLAHLGLTPQSAMNPFTNIDASARLLKENLVKAHGDYQTALQMWNPNAPGYGLDVFRRMMKYQYAEVPALGVGLTQQARAENLGLAQGYNWAAVANAPDDLYNYVKSGATAAAQALMQFAESLGSLVGLTGGGNQAAPPNGPDVQKYINGPGLYGNLFGTGGPQ